MNRKGRIPATLALVGVVSLAIVSFFARGVSAEDALANAKYEGSDKCKNCHKAKTKGDQFGKWEQSKHAKAFETLATEEAKKIAKDKGIEDPQKAEQCLKCHQTAFGVDAKALGKKFDPSRGVQCEACHGPGSVHAKARLAAAATVEGDAEPPAPSAEELAKEIKKSDEATCLKCHNKESPTYKEFKYEERQKDIEHSKLK